MQHLRVLMLEDTDSDAERVTAWLDAVRHARFEVVRALTLADALARLAAESFDVALVDLCVPDSKGPQTFRRVASAARDIPIIVLSGLEAEGLAVQTVAGGAQDYLVKRHMSAPLLERALLYAVERARVDRALRESEARYKLAVDGARDAVWDWDLPTGRFFLSSRWNQMLGLDGSDTTHAVEDWLARVHPDDLVALEGALHEHFAGTTQHLENEHRVRTADGGWHWVLARGLAVRDADGQPVRLAGSISDVHTRRLAEERFRHAALHDALTGLPNRALFVDRLGHAILRSRRRGEARFAVLFLDVDRFKDVNDSLGHSAGDALLVAIARRLSTCVRPGDTVARLGGDEFAIVLDRLAAPDQAPGGAVDRVADRIRQALALPVQVGSTEIYPTASIGIARGTGEYASPEEVLRDADTAMYQAKRQGRDRHVAYERSLGLLARARLEVQNGLCRALERAEFVVHYQPIVSLVEGRTVALEALVRWNCPGRGLLLPEAFLDAAEENGQVVPLGKWVMETACREVAWLRRQDRRWRDVQLAVNVSGRQLADAALVHDLEAAFGASGFDPARFGLELTETALIASPELAAEQLRAVRALGVRIHLDDFGSGYSSLRWLHQFPIDSLKIDWAFVSGLLDREKEAAIVRAVIALAGSLALEVVAEGIETEPQRRRLLELQCTFGQGYFFGAPRPVDQLLEAGRVRPLAGVRQAGALLTPSA